MIDERAAVANAIQVEHPDIGRYSLAEILAHVVATALNAGLVVADVAWLRGHTSSIGIVALAAVPALASGLAVADLISGILHWALDTWFDGETAGLGRMVKTVREHHIYPSDIFQYKLRHHVGVLSVPALGFSAPVSLPVLLWVEQPAFVSTFLVMMAVTASLAVVFMFETHKVGHRRAVGRTCRALGSWGLLVTPRHHMLHHAHRHDQNYCLINGWADRFMDSINGWRRLEQVISRYTGAVARQDDRAWRQRYGGRSLRDSGGRP